MKKTLPSLFIALILFASCKKSSTTDPTAPTVTTSGITVTSSATVTGGGDITADGGGTVMAEGLIWSTTPNLSTALSTKTNDGVTDGIFTSTITGLSPHVTYYAVAYVTTNGGTAYGNMVSFTTSGLVSTFAGSGAIGFLNGQSTAATFFYPYSVAADANGNIYVADLSNNAIRKITSAGLVSTLAGSGTAGFVNGQGTAASFNYPYGLAVDANGNVYVADLGNEAIRKITPAGLVTTLAGSGTAAYADGQGTAASFNNPTGLAVDANYNVYVADIKNNAIRKITPAGLVSTLAGSTAFGFVNGQGTAATFFNPTDVAVDANGNVYVADLGNQAIRKITSAGVVSTLAGSGNAGALDGQGTAASFYGPSSVAVDANGNVYVADKQNNSIRKITPTGLVSTLAGTGAKGALNGSSASASFRYPTGVAVDANTNVYVADSNNNLIRKITQ